MKKVVFLIVFGVFFALLASYLLNSTSPFVESELEKIIHEKEIYAGEWDKLTTELQTLLDKGLIFNVLSTNAYLLLLLVLLSIGSFFAALHLVIDKLFFKEFYEKASTFDAIRRAVLLDITLVLFIFLRLYGVADYYLVIAPLLVLLFEVTFSKFFKAEFLEKVKEFQSLQNN